MEKSNLPAVVCGLVLLSGMMTAEAAPLEVFVSILPQKTFVERVGGEHVAVSVLVGPGQSPHTFEPSPKQMVGVSKAGLFFSIGVTFEEVWLPRLRETNPRMTIVDLCRGITLRTMGSHEECHEDHAHEHHAHHEDGRKDPHTWLSPPLVKTMAATIRDALEKARPDQRDFFQANYATFAGELDQLDREVREMLKDIASKKFMVFHPAWGYFADAYGLEQIPIEAEGKEPGPKSLARLIAQGKKEKVRVIFVQEQFSTNTAESIARAIGARVVTADPLAEDYLTNMRRIAKSFAEALE
jgi:zinc transport system substrate-binding protein